MSFFTEIDIPEFPWKIDYSKKIQFFGSCFAENIGQKMADQKFNIDLNPFGILYNPVSIANSLKILLEKRLFTKDDLFYSQGLWNSFSHHSRFSDSNPEAALQKMNERTILSHEFLQNADFLIITFGTSWVFELKETGKIVSNCHKIAPSGFKRYRLGVLEIIDVYRELLEEIWKFNPKIKIVFTVSPIRHWKDGAVENQLSKATLLLAIDRLIRGFGAGNCQYFPAYELMMDELRDYRFYTDDMLHIGPVAIDYIYNRFCQTMVSPESMKVVASIVKVLKSVHHRPVNRETEEYRRFLLSNLEQLRQLADEYPLIRFNDEIAELEQKLNV